MFFNPLFIKIVTVTLFLMYFKNIYLDPVYTHTKTMIKFIFHVYNPSTVKNGNTEFYIKYT